MSPTFTYMISRWHINFWGCKCLFLANVYMGYCWWFRNPANQLRFVVYHVIDRVLYLSSGAGFLPTIWFTYCNCWFGAWKISVGPSSKNTSSRSSNPSIPKHQFLPHGRFFLHLFSPEKERLLNLKITKLNRNIIWTEPPFLDSNCCSSRVYDSMDHVHC